MIWTLQSLFGQFFDATVGQMLTALGGPRPVNRSSPWNAAPPGARPALPPAPGASPSSAAAAWQPAGSSVSVAVELQESLTPSPKDLDDDTIKVVKYALVSIRRCHEKVLSGGVILVNTPMTSASFSSWIVALYLQSPEYRAAVARDRSNAIAHADKKYLRVSYGVLRRYPREPKSGCGTKKLDALKGIREALLGLRLPPRTRPAPPPPAPATRRRAAASTALAPAPEPTAPSPPRPRRPRSQASAPGPAEPPPAAPRRPGRRPPGRPQRRPR
jgi:hypothetical protein